LIDSNKKKLLIIDDIADSFDYKNKYAIIEYIREISKIVNFKIVILSHNFDFYRTLSSRINMSRKNKFSINKTISNKIEIIEEEYQ
jgi:wobble nucleotide-excising tRNase